MAGNDFNEIIKQMIADDAYGMSGFELQDVLASQGAGLPIIFITGHDDLLAQRSRIERASGYLRKPFATSALLALLQPHLDAALLD